MGPLLLRGAAASVALASHASRVRSCFVCCNKLSDSCAVAQCVGALRGGHRASVVSVAFSPSGKFLLSVGAERNASLCLWDWREGTMLASAAAPGPSCSVAFAADDSRFFTAGSSYPLRLWHVRPAAGKAGAAMQIALGPPPAGAPAGDKGYAGVVSRSGAVIALSTSGRLSTLRPGGGFDRYTEALSAGSAPACVLAVSPSHIAVGGARAVVRLFDPSTLAFVGTLPWPAARGKLDVRSLDEACRLAKETPAETLPDVVALRRELSACRTAPAPLVQSTVQDLGLE